MTKDALNRADKVWTGAMGAGWLVLAAICWVQDGPTTSQIAFLGMYVWALTARERNEYYDLARRSLRLVDLTLDHYEARK